MTGAALLVASRAKVTTSPNVALTSVVLVAANSDRRAFMLYNNSANSVYVTYGPTSGSSSCSVIIASFSGYTHNAPVAYIGPLSGIRNAGSGAVIVTEFLV